MSDEKTHPKDQLYSDDDVINIRLRLKLVADKAKNLRYQAESIEKELQEIWFRLLSPPDASQDIKAMKRSDGRLNDAGIAAINAAFKSNTSVGEVAKTFGISQSAASNRKKIWLAEKATAVGTTNTKDQR